MVKESFEQPNKIESHTHTPDSASERLPRDVIQDVLLHHSVERGEFANVKVALFDVGNILYSFSRGINALSELTNHPRKRCESIWHEMDDAICRGRIAPQELWNRIKHESGYSRKDIDFIPFWVNHFHPNKGVHALMKTLSKQYAIGLMQNVYPGTYAEALRRKKVPNIPLAFNLQSCDVGLVKPEERIYETAERYAGVSGKDILYVDDIEANVVPARNRGWNTFTFDAHDPDRSVARLREGFRL